MHLALASYPISNCNLTQITLMKNTIFELLQHKAPRHIVSGICLLLVRVWKSLANDVVVIVQPFCHRLQFGAFSMLFVPPDSITF